jgi:opacity protein-like surface antigen
VKRILCIAALSLLAALPAFAATPAPPQTAQEKQASRDATREKLRKLLETAGARKDVNVAFRQSDKQPYNFLGVMNTGLVNADSLEIVVGVTTNETVGFRIYPHYKGGYINVDKVKNSAGLMRKLLFLSDRNFLYWGIDESGDVFSGYTFTLESGFPDEAMTIVLRSIHNTDGFVGEMRPLIDGSSAP